MVRAVVDSLQEYALLPKLLSHITVKQLCIFFRVISSSNSCLIRNHNKLKAVLIEKLHPLYHAGQKTEVLRLMEVRNFFVNCSVPI